MSKKVAVIGASGFIGRHLVRDLAERGYLVMASSRRPIEFEENVSWISIPDLENLDVVWPDVIFEGVDIIIYLAARVHVTRDDHDDSLGAYIAVNRDAPLSLATKAAQAGVKRFIYLSSVKVNGEKSQVPFKETDLPKPKDFYGLSKMEAEYGLLQSCKESGMEIVIIRPPLVYGNGVGANFMALANLVGLGLPLPFGKMNNKRSMVYVGNLTDFIITTMEHPSASGEIFMVSDDGDLSVSEMVQMLAEAQGKRVYLLGVPISLLKILGELLGKREVIRRLTESLQVDVEKASLLLGWSPPYPVWQAMARTGRDLYPQPYNNNMVADKIYLTPSQKFYLTFRQPLERLLAALCLLIIFPVWLLISSFIIMDSRGPALFVQQRAGKHHKPFRIYKFRTMRVETPDISTENMRASGLNPVTRIGAVLRATSLDEIPQLLNIVKGEMSFVGPRPALMTQAEVLSMREVTGVDGLLPGITGYAQVMGRDDLCDKDKVGYDKQYMVNLGLWYDIKVLIFTIKSVLTGVGNR